MFIVDHINCSEIHLISSKLLLLVICYFIYMKHMFFCYLNVNYKIV